MNNIRAVQAANKKELENGVSTEASWHADFRDTAYVFVGGLPLDLTEGDVIAIFSQFGEPVFLNLVRDKETGKSRGFGFLKYEDQRSTDLAVDNLGGATIMGRVLRVDHTRYKRKDGEALSDNTAGIPSGSVVSRGGEDDGERGVKRQKTAETDTEAGEGERRPLIQEERELAELMRNHDDDDPMKDYLIKEKREEVEAALAAMAKGNRARSSYRDGGKQRSETRERGAHRSHRHHHHHASSSRREEQDKRDDGERQRHRQREEDPRQRRFRSKSREQERRITRDSSR
ncbi:MAG: hypothetical protein M1829_003114 [Trizodia sp. TS-e1964]|nr:MAG: hypothetical protein M1829_003114 [Trizodia sp. TS-e1964]